MRQLIRCLALSLTTIVVAPMSVTAQRTNGLRVGLSNPISAEAPTPAVLRRDVAPTHWKEGMIIGGVVGLAIGAAANSFEKAFSEDPYRPFSYSTLFISMGLFAILGGLIGSGSRK